jgi:hypothetical protein
LERKLLEFIQSLPHDDKLPPLGLMVSHHRPRGVALPLLWHVSRCRDRGLNRAAEQPLSAPRYLGLGRRAYAAELRLKPIEKFRSTREVFRGAYLLKLAEVWAIREAPMLLATS